MESTSRQHSRITFAQCVSRRNDQHVPNATRTDKTGGNADKIAGNTTDKTTKAANGVITNKTLENRSAWGPGTSPVNRTAGNTTDKTVGNTTDKTVGNTGNHWTGNKHTNNHSNSSNARYSTTTGSPYSRSASKFKATSIIPVMSGDILAENAVYSDITRHGIRYYDEHTLYIMYGPCTITQLKDALNSAMKQASIVLKRKVDKEPIINMVTTADGKSLGYGYVWIPEPEVYFLLAGMNPNGTERVEYIDDPNWTPPSTPGNFFDDLSFDDWPSKDTEDSGTSRGESDVTSRSRGELAHRSADGICTMENKETNVHMLSSPMKASSWADLLAEEEAQICPKIRVKLPPLVTLPPFKLTPEQLKKPGGEKYRQTSYNGVPEKCPLSSEGDMQAFDVTRADVGEIEDRDHHNILCSTRPIPVWLNESDLKKIFQPYVTDTTARYRHHGKSYDQDTFEPYPNIVIDRKRMAFITFNPSSRDAQFAILMTKKVTAEKSGNTQVLLFDKYCKQSNR